MALLQGLLMHQSPWGAPGHVRGREGATCICVCCFYPLLSVLMAWVSKAREILHKMCIKRLCGIGRKEGEVPPDAASTTLKHQLNVLGPPLLDSLVHFTPASDQQPNQVRNIKSGQYAATSSGRTFAAWGEPTQISHVPLTPAHFSVTDEMRASATDLIPTMAHPTLCWAECGHIKNLSVVPPVAPYPPPGVEASELPQQITQLPTEDPYVGKPHNFDAERSPPV